jgi:hypothetical protein
MRKTYVFSTILALTTLGCALQTHSQVESPQDVAQETASRNRPSGEEAAPRLPDSLIGTWVPYGRGYQQFGDLKIERELLSWGPCRKVGYRVFRATNDTYYIEQTQQPPCNFDGGASFLVVQFSDRARETITTSAAVEVSMCGHRDEFDRPPEQRYCSRGLLAGRQD